MYSNINKQVLMICYSKIDVKDKKNRPASLKKYRFMCFLREIFHPVINWSALWHPTNKQSHKILRCSLPFTISFMWRPQKVPQTKPKSAESSQIANECSSSSLFWRSVPSSTGLDNQSFLWPPFLAFIFFTRYFYACFLLLVLAVLIVLEGW